MLYQVTGQLKHDRRICTFLLMKWAFQHPLTALCAQTQTKENLESVALQRFQDSL
jgi:hypothetical protein